LFIVSVMDQFPDEIYGLIVDSLDDKDRFGSFGLLSKRFHDLSFALPYRALIISALNVHSALNLVGSLEACNVKGGLLTNIGRKIDGSFVEEIRIDAGHVDKSFLTEIMAICKNCRTLSIMSLARLDSFDFSGFTHLHSLTIHQMHYTDELKFGSLEHLSIKAKYEANRGPYSEYITITPQNDSVSKNIETIPTLLSLELSTDFFVSRAVFSKLPSYNVLPSYNYAGPPPEFIGRGDPYQYLEPTFFPYPPPPLQVGMVDLTPQGSPNIVQELNEPKKVHKKANPKKAHRKVSAESPRPPVPPPGLY